MVSILMGRRQKGARSETIGFSLFVTEHKPVVRDKASIVLDRQRHCLRTKKFVERGISRQYFVLYHQQRLLTVPTFITSTLKGLY